MEDQTAIQTCETCGDPIPSDHPCDNPACPVAQVVASRPAKGETVSARLAPAAFTIRGDID